MRKIIFGVFSFIHANAVLKQGRSGIGVPKVTYVLLAVTAACWFFFFCLSKRCPYRLGNAVLLLFDLVLTAAAVAALFGDGAVQALLIGFLVLLLILFLVPVMLIWNGIVMIRRESGRLSNILSLLLGFIIAAGESSFFLFIYNGGSLVYSDQSWLLFFIGASVLYGSILMLGFVLYDLFLPLLMRKENFDALIVHGCALIHGDRVSKILSGRLDLAASLHHRGNEKGVIVVSGGQGDDETVSEAAAMRDYLLKKGVAEDHILQEEKSRSTKENLLFSVQMIDTGPEKKLALVTSNYHLYRCLLTAKELGIRCKGYGSPVAAYYWPSAVIREFAAVFSRRKYLFFSLLGYGFFVLLPFFVLITA